MLTPRYDAVIEIGRAHNNTKRIILYLASPLEVDSLQQALPNNIRVDRIDQEGWEEGLELCINFKPIYEAEHIADELRDILISKGYSEVKIVDLTKEDDNE